MGPTATGKTELALRLADYIQIEIINVDSVLIYKDMNIGAAKPTLDELNKVPHHLIDIISPLDSYSVAEFLNSTHQLINDIAKRGNTPVLVGGTMMYYNALLNGISELPQSNPLIRDKLEQRAKNDGVESLYTELSTIDIKATQKISFNDKQRIIRALEVFYITGKPITQVQTQTNNYKLKNMNLLSLCILPVERDILHQRINSRFDKMINRGFIDEVLHLQKKYPTLTNAHTSMRSVGYYQVWQYLENIIDKFQMLEMGKAATRQLAKRQITWLRKFEAINIAKNGFNLDNMYLELTRLVDNLL